MRKIELLEELSKQLNQSISSGDVDQAQTLLFIIKELDTGDIEIETPEGPPTEETPSDKINSQPNEINIPPNNNFILDEDSHLMSEFTLIEDTVQDNIEITDFVFVENTKKIPNRNSLIVYKRDHIDEYSSYDTVAPLNSVNQSDHDKEGGEASHTFIQANKITVKNEKTESSLNRMEINIGVVIEEKIEQGSECEENKKASEMEGDGGKKQKEEEIDDWLIVTEKEEESDQLKSKATAAPVKGSNTNAKNTISMFKSFLDAKLKKNVHTNNNNNQITNKKTMQKKLEGNPAESSKKIEIATATVPSCAEVGCIQQNPGNICCKCNKHFCKEHVKMMKDVLFLGFKNHLKCIMNTNDEILFDLMLMEASSICNDCISIHIQSIGVINDKTSSFKQMRREYQKPVITKYSSQLRVISKNLISLDQEMKDSPIKSSLSTTFSTINPFKKIVWTAKDTYLECVGCEEYFEQFAVKKLCQLCWKLYCTSCDTTPIRFSSKLFPNISHKAGVYELRACKLCRNSISFASRRHSFFHKKEIQRADLVQSRHKELHDIRANIDRLLDDFFSISQSSDTSNELQTSIQHNLELYKRLSNLLEANVSNPLQGDKLNHTEVRLIKALYQAHSYYLKERYSLFRAHANHLNKK